MSDDLKPGFYERPDGSKHYWDGSQWLKPVDDAKPGASFNVSRKGLALAGVAVLLAGGGYVAFSAISNAQADAAFEEEVERLQATHERKADSVSGFFESAVDSCSTESEIPGVDYGSDYMTIDVQGEEDFFGASYLDYFCLIAEVDVSAIVEDRMGSTRALDGTQTGEWEILNGDATVLAEWRYHPNSGPALTMALESDYLDPFVPPKREE